MDFKDTDTRPIEHGPEWYAEEQQLNGYEDLPSLAPPDRPDDAFEPTDWAWEREWERQRAWDYYEESFK